MTTNDANRSFRLRWLTLGEWVGVGALAVAALGFIDSHRARHRTEIERAASAQRDAAGAPFVLRGESDGTGRRLLLSPLDHTQVVQLQRYLFPRVVLDHPMEISAAAPQIDLDWIARGLERDYVQTHRRGVFEGRAPVGITSNYVEDGRARRDISIYDVGYRIAPGGLFRSPHAVLLGLALERGSVGGNLGQEVERDWRRLDFGP